MDIEEQSIVEEYSSSLEDLTFNSKPLINVLTMLAEENSRYSSSVTKLIEERIYKVPQNLKLPSLYLLDSIIKNVGGSYLSLIAQVLVKVFVSVFEKGDEKTRKDLYKLRHTWPQYFSTKILHDVDVNINKIDPGWPITAVPPPSPSIHVNPKFLKKNEVQQPQIPVNVPTVKPKEDEKELLLEQQKRLSELQRLQEEQLRLTEQEIQEHQMKRDLILKKQEQERKALMTQQQQLLLKLRLESELEASTSQKTSSISAISTKAEMPPSSHSVTTSRDPRLQRQEQAPLHDGSNGSQRRMDTNHHIMPESRPSEHAIASTNSSKRSRSQSPPNDRVNKFQRHDGYAKNKDMRPAQDKHVNYDRPLKRRRSLDGTEGQDGFRDRGERGFQRGRGQRGIDGYAKGGRMDDARSHRGNKEGERADREGQFSRERGGNEREKAGRVQHVERDRRDKRVIERGRGGRGRGARGRGERGTRNQERFNRDDKKQGPIVSRQRDQESENLKKDNTSQPKPVSEDIVVKNNENLEKSEPLLPKKEVIEMKTSEGNEYDSDSAVIPQELSLEHRSEVLEEAKRRLDAGHITQEQYIELIDKLCEFYELQRQQEIESEQSDETLTEQSVPEIVPQKNEEANEKSLDRSNQRARGGRSNRRNWRRRGGEDRNAQPRKEFRGNEFRRRDGPGGRYEESSRPSRIVKLDDHHPPTREPRPLMETHLRDTDRPPHEQRPHFNHQSELPGPPFPNDLSEREFRQHGMDPRHFDQRFHRDEPLLDRDHRLPGEGHPLAHGPHFRGERHMPNSMEPVTSRAMTGPPGERHLRPNELRHPPFSRHGEPLPGHDHHPIPSDIPPLIPHREPGPGIHADHQIGPPGMPPLIRHREPEHSDHRHGQPGVPPVMRREPERFEQQHGPLSIPPLIHDQEPHPHDRHRNIPPLIPKSESDHPDQLQRAPGVPPLIHDREPDDFRPIGVPPLIRHRLPDHPDQQPGIPSLKHDREPLHQFDSQPGLPAVPPLIRHREPDIVTSAHHDDPGQHPGHIPGPQPGNLPGEPLFQRDLPPDFAQGQQGRLGMEGPGLQGMVTDHHPNAGHLFGPIHGSPQRHGTDTPPPSIRDNAPPTPSRMDKKTVNDLFSKLVHAGIIKVAEEPVMNTPPRIATPPAMQPPIEPSSSASAFQGLPPVSQTTTTTPMNLQKLQEMIEKSREASTKIPILSLNPHDLKKRHTGIITLLYKGKQCSTCGLRFVGEAEAFYREHLDWHFRRNRREKDGRRIAHKQWFIPLKDWLEYEEITDPEEKAHSSFFDAEKKPSADKNQVAALVGDGSCPVLPTDTETESMCDICQEKFEQFWEETSEEWHYKDAIRAGGKTYHEMCYQDAKKSNVEETATDADATVETSGSEEEAAAEPVEVKKDASLEVKKDEAVEDKKEETIEVKKEDPEVKQEDVKQEYNNMDVDVPSETEVQEKVNVKIENVESVSSQSSEVSKDNKELSTKCEEVKVKIEVNENNSSKTIEENKNTNETVIKTENTDKD